MPNIIKNIQNLKSDALFTLIVEKDATFQRLLDDNFTFKYPAILITVNIFKLVLNIIKYDLGQR